MAEIHEVVVYSRRGCHLCDVAKDILKRLESYGGFRWQEVDIDLDPSLHAKFTNEVPVIFIDGRKAFKYRIDEAEFLKRIRRPTG